MRLLILGETRFVGRHVVEAARARGHTLTLFNRGRSDAELFPELEHLGGDRDVDLSALRGRRWDVVVDTSAYVPRQVRTAAQALAEVVERYLFISTICVYADYSRPHMDEQAPLTRLADPTTEEVTFASYGPLKVLCEAELEQALPGRLLIVRPGIVAGPHDDSDRFTYWVRRVARGGEMLAPGRPDRPLLFIDARDLGEWLVRMVEVGASGIYNANGPPSPITMQQFLAVCREVSGSDARLTWVPDAFLRQAGVLEWTEQFFSLPQAEDEISGLQTLDCRKAQAAGLTYRPLETTVRETLEWDKGRAEIKMWSGLSPEQEQELLRAWRDARH
jgi:2'-hydroxyisoflavone reductase